MLSDVSGQTTYKLQVGGKTYELRPWSLRALAIVENYARQLYIERAMQAAAKAAEHVPAEQRPLYWEKCFESCEPRGGITELLNSLPAYEQLACTLFMAVYSAHKDEFPDPGNQRFREFVDQALEEHGMDFLDALVAQITNLRSVHGEKKAETNRTGES
jgi:hypothetical protein